MRHRKNSKSNGGKWVLTYTKDELKHKDFHLEKMIADRQKKISDFKIEQIKLEEKLALLRAGVSEEIIEIEKKIRNIEWVKPRELNCFRLSGRVWVPAFDKFLNKQKDSCYK